MHAPCQPPISCWGDIGDGLMARYLNSRSVPKQPPPAAGKPLCRNHANHRGSITHFRLAGIGIDQTPANLTAICPVASNVAFDPRRSYIHRLKKHLTAFLLLAHSRFSVSGPNDPISADSRPADSSPGKSPFRGCTPCRFRCSGVESAWIASGKGRSPFDRWSFA